MPSRSGPFLSAIIPTKNRAATLKSTLAKLREQTPVEGGVEIIVADNGSTDDTWEVLRHATEQLPGLIAVRQSKPGPAAARNAAVASAGGEVLLLLGDDTAPEHDDLFATHAALHRAEADATYAVLGRLEWAGRPTDFMRWLDAGGPQFHYFELGPGEVDPRFYFYSSHLSLKRAIYEEGGRFDERFPFAAFEDTDFGSRLGARGLRLDYHPELVVLHDHPTSISSSLQRAERVGRSAAIYNSLDTAIPNPRIGGPGPVGGAVAVLASPALSIASHLPAPIKVRHRIWSAAHRCNYAIGYRHGRPEQKR
jgi:glycosyltransferase AglI